VVLGVDLVEEVGHCHVCILARVAAMLLPGMQSGGCLVRSHVDVVERRAGDTNVRLVLVLLRKSILRSR
jgi:hypothetical protein